MSNKVPKEDDPVQFITGGDWSVGLNSPSSLSQAELMTVLGRGLQRLYDGVLDEGTPDHLAALVAKIEKRKD